MDDVAARGGKAELPVDVSTCQKSRYIPTSDGIGPWAWLSWAEVGDLPLLKDQAPTLALTSASIPLWAKMWLAISQTLSKWLQNKVSKHKSFRRGITPVLGRWRLQLEKFPRNSFDLQWRSSNKFEAQYAKDNDFNFSLSFDEIPVARIRLAIPVMEVSCGFTPIPLPPSLFILLSKDAYLKWMVSLL